MNLIFFGSSDFSLKALEACVDSGHRIVRVVTMPAAHKGRGLKIESTVVKDHADRRGLTVSEFASLKTPEVVAEIRDLKPDIFVVSSYGKIIPGDLLVIPSVRLNVHPSLVPLYRGAAPVNWPILNGDAETGISIIDIAEKMDAGDIYFQKKVPVHPRINAAELMDELAKLSYDALMDVFRMMDKNALRAFPQDGSKATVARKLVKEDGLFSFAEDASTIDRKVRGLTPWPSAYFFHNNERVALISSEPDAQDFAKLPGTILSVEKDGGIRVAAGKGTIKLVRVKPEGKNVMFAADYVHGRRLNAGDMLKN